MDDALTLLRLQMEWGADEAIEPNASDHLRPVAAPQAFRPQAVPLAEMPRGTAGEQAVGLAGRATTLEELRAALGGFAGCALRDTASNLVFAEGDPASTTLIIGDPPGREEDRGGHPFAGPEGELLDQMLASIRLSRAELMLTPMLPWRPPGGRPPSPGEIAVCLPFLQRLIVLLNPQRIVLFGGAAARALLSQAQSRRRVAPGWVGLHIAGVELPLRALVLPGVAEMLKNPRLRRDAWAGLRMLRRAIDQISTKT